MAGNEQTETRERAKRPSPRKKRGGGVFFDVISVMLITSALVILSASLLIINDPSIAINPLPATDLPTLFLTLTPSATATPSATPTDTVTPIPPTASPTNTSTPLPTNTPTPTSSPTPVIPGLADPPTAVVPSDRGTPEVDTNAPGIFDPEAEFAFAVFTVRFEQNTRDAGCNWASIAGNVTGANGEPIVDLAVEVTGDDFEFTTFAGLQPLFGASGFEVQVGAQPFRDNYAVRLLGPDGEMLSEFVEIETGDTCGSNVVVIEFVQVGDY